MKNTAATRTVLAEMLARPSEEHYGYDLLKALGIKAGSLYPILDRLESEGWLTSEWRDSPGNRPRRRCYRLTGLGTRQAKLLLSDAGTDTSRRLAGA